MIKETDKFVTSINEYNRRKKELMELPNSVDIMKDKRLIFCSEQIQLHGKKIFAVKIPAKKPKTKK